MTTYPLPTLAATVTAAGISAPSYPDILASLQASFRLIYGADVYLEADSQDGQLLAIFAAAINDSNATAIAVYSAFSPATAQGEGLSSVVKINGLARLVPTHSTADVTLVGQAGTVISNGIVADDRSQQWALPASVTIPNDGDIVVTATAVAVGDIAAAAGSITTIVTPTRGWQSVTNVLAATPGAPVESDAALRRRQGASTALPAETPAAGILAAVLDLSGILAARLYVNDTGSTDGNGIPAHSIALVVQGGDVTEIAEAIAAKKSPGTGTYGSTSEVVVDSAGISNTIKFSRPTVKRVELSVTGSALDGYASTTGDFIKAALAAYVSGLAVGYDVYQSKLFGPAALNNSDLGATYNITDIELRFHGGSFSTSDLTIAFNEVANLDVADITLTVS